MKRYKTSVATVIALLLFAGCDIFPKKTQSQDKITFMLSDTIGDSLSGEYADKVLQKQREWTGVDVSFRLIPDKEYNEQAAKLLSSGENLPEIMLINSITQDVVNAAERGDFWDLNEFIWDKAKYPNLSQANRNVCKSLEIDGKLIGLYKGRDIGRNGLSYRKDWAEKFGFSEPKTPEDVYNMMYAFTYGDPDGNGINDTYGLAMCSYTGPLDIIQTWFGAGNAWAEEGGKIVPIHQTAAYKDALDWMRNLYEEGLMPADWATADTKTWQDQIVKGKAGVFIDVMDGGRRIWDNLIKNKVPSVVNPEDFASMSLVGAINDKTLATAGYMGFFAITKSATKAQAEQCLHFIDKMCDDEMLILGGYGLEGVHYDRNGNTITVRKDKPGNKSYAILAQMTCFVPHSLAEAKYSEKQTDRKLRELSVIRENKDKAVFNPAAAYIANSQTYSKVGKELDKIISDARTKYICGEINEAGLQEEFDRWNKAGGTAVLSEVNAQYRAEEEE